MDNKIKIIDFNECQTWRMKEEGLGGVRVFARTEDDEVFVVKPKALNQTLNEVMAQIILNSLGLTSIEYAFVLIDGIHYGALRYLDGLTRIYKKDYKFLTKKQKIEYLKHLFINAFFANDDIDGEIYLTKDGNVVSFDYGEAGVSIPLLDIDKKSDHEKNIILSMFHKRSELNNTLSYIRLCVNSACKYYIDDIVSIVDLKQAIVDVIDGFIDADHSEYEVFLKELLTLHGELLAFIYQEHFNGLIEAAEKLRDSINSIFADLLGD